MKTKLLFSFMKSGRPSHGFNDNDKILTGSAEIALFAHAQYKFGKNRPEQLAQSCNASQLPHFLCCMSYHHLQTRRGNTFSCICLSVMIELSKALT